MQEVFLQLVRTPPPITGNDERIKAWLIRVTINKSKDFLRVRKRRREAAIKREPFAQSAVCDDVFEALSKLSEHDRTVIYLHYYEGYKAKEIACITGGSERAVTKRIARAREKLKSILEE